ncbi:phage tail tape measure protein [Staphylococcus americanisciuri]|uniref:lysostaphin n=1 Tax=Staphylococcus americanisciuri TaxID=2973940 RepID=A0ABT2F2K7_9STAP|nr:phage tail tape measure protein [Staphylococcus americanisciuri]MCS4486388.1 phage tail tape measure protein [Staphylococcus americanisciuri]
MANNVRGFSILMNMEDIGVKRTLSQIKSQFRTLSTEMKRSSNDFAHADKSMLSLKQRSKELSKGIQVTENSMKDIESQLKKMSKEEQQTSVHAERLRTEYSKQHRALNMYKRQLVQTDKELRRFSGSTKYTVFSMEKVNDVLGTMRRQLNVANMTFEKGEKSTKSYNNYLKQLNLVIEKHKRTIQSLEARYRLVSKQQGATSKAALELKEKILQEKQSLSILESQYKKTTAESKRFLMEQSTMTKSMSQIREQIKSVTNALKISASKFRLSGQTAQAYKAHISELNNGMKQQQLIVQSLSRQYDYAKRQYGSTSNEAQELNLKLTEERVKLKELSSQLKDTTNAHNRLEMEQKQGVSTMSEIRAKMQSFNDVLSLSRSNLSHAGESVRAYKAHLSTLNTNMSQQKTVLHELKMQYDFVAQAQSKNSNEARELASAIAQQKIKMNELESEIKQTSIEYKKLFAEQQRAQRLSATAFGRGIQSVNKYNDSIRNISGTMHSVGSSALIYMTLPTIAAMGGAIKASIDWEQALAGVAKTTNLSGRELNKMSKEITDMSNKLPFASTEVAAVAESAGQLGVAKKDITAFTKTMLDLGVATNLTSEEAATEFARFANAAKMPIKDVDRLGSTVTALGNSTATTEKEIVEMAQRLAGAGHQAGLSADQIVSIAAAMSSVGIEAEAGGTAMTQIFNKMTRAVADGGDTLDSFARTSGVSAEQFAQVWENNPSKALSMFVKGLSKTEGGAKGVLKALDDVGIKGIREADTIRRMANNHKVLDEALKTGAEGWKKNTALTDEASIRYETMGSKLKVLKNTFINFLRTIGDAFAPLIIKVSDAFTSLFTHLQNTSSVTKIAITVFALMTAAIPPLLIGAGLLGGAITNIAKAVMVLNGTKGGAAFFNLFNGGIKSALPRIGQLITKIPMIGGAVTALSGPIGWAIAAIVAIGAAFVVAYKKVDWFRDGIDGLIDVIKVFGGKILSGLTNTVKGSIKYFKDWRDSLPKDDLLKKSAVALDLYKSGFKKIMKVLASAKDKATDVSDALGSGVSKSTKKALEGFVKYSEDSDKILAEIKNNHGRITFEEKTELINIQKSMTDELVNQLNIRAEKQRNIQEEVFKQNSGLTAKHEQEIMERSKRQFATSEARIREISARIQELVDKQAKDGKLTGQEMKELNKLYDEQRDLAVGTLSSTHKEQERILSVMSANREAYGLKEAESIVKNAVKARDVAKKENQKRYDQEVDNINQMVGLSEDEKNRLLQNAQDRYDKANQKADENHQKIINGVKKNNQDIETEMDLSNGRVYSNSEKWWNQTLAYLQNMWGRTRLLWDVFTVWFTTSVNSIWKSISDKWKAIKDYTVYIWENVKNTVKGKASEMWNAVKNVWSNLYSSTRSIFNNVRSFLINIFNNIRSNVSNIASNLWASVRRTFNNMLSGISSIFNRVKWTMINAWNYIKRSVTGIASSLWSSVRRTFNNMASGLSSIIGRIKSHINGMVGAVKRGINSLIKGINWVGGKVGLSKIPYFSAGTTHTTTHNIVTNGKVNDDTLAVVGDKGRGNGSNGFRHEMIRYPNGNMVITPDTDTLTMLPKGSQVYNGKQTQQFLSPTNNKKLPKNLPRFSTGTGAGSILDTVTDVIDDAMAFGKDIFEFASNPGKLVRLMLDKFGVNFNNLKGSLFRDFMNAALKMLTKSITNIFKKALEEGAMGGDGSSFTSYTITTPYSPGGPVAGYGFNGGRHYGIDYGTPYGTVLRATRSGYVSRQHNYGGGLVARLVAGKFAEYFLHLSSVFKTGRVTKGQPFARTGNSGAWTTGPHLHYQVESPPSASITNRNTINPATFLRGKKYASGGLISSPGWYNIAEGGYPEYIIPTDPSKKSDAMKLIALAAHNITNSKNSKNKRPGQLPNISGDSDNTSLLLQMIQNQQIQIDQQRKQMELLMEIAKKKLIVDEDSMERVHNRFQDKRERLENKLKKYKK